MEAGRAYLKASNDHLPSTENLPGGGSVWMHARLVPRRLCLDLELVQENATSRAGSSY